MPIIIYHKGKSYVYVCAYVYIYTICMYKGTYVNEYMFKDHMCLFENKKLDKYKELSTKMHK